MAIADDFTVAVNGDIRHSAGSTHYTVLELHRFLQGLADDEAPATGSDYIDITSLTSSERSTDNIITLINNYNIDDTASEYFYAGSITQDGGNTVYSGLKVLGAVNDINTQLMVIQDNNYYQFTTTPALPFWGDQSTGGYNGDATGGVLMRVLIKTRQYGADIDQKRIRVQSRAWGDSYDFFGATLGQGEGVAAIGTTPDAQNTTAIATVQGWTGGNIPTNTEGWQNINILNGNGNKPYYSKWTYNTNAAGRKAIWEYIKEITGNDSPEAAAPHGRNGELFLGPTHTYAYDGDSGAFTEDETVVWGTGITYDGLTGGTFSAGDYVVFKRATVIVNAGKVLYDNGTTHMRVALENIAFTLLDNDVIEEAGAGPAAAAIHLPVVVGNGTDDLDFTVTANTITRTAGSWIADGYAVGQQVNVTDSVNNNGVKTVNTVVALILTVNEALVTELNVAATVTVTIRDGDKSGGEGILLGEDATGNNQYIQLVSGLAPVDNLPIRGITSAATGLIFGSVTAKTIPKTFLGSYTGSLIGAYGIGLDPDDLSATDTVTPLVGATQTPPNNVTYTLSGLVVGDRVLIGKKATGTDFKWDEMTLATALVGATETQVDVGVAGVPADAPATGVLRVTLDDGRVRRVAYTAHGTQYFTIASSSWVDPNDAAIGKGVMLAFIDKAAAATYEEFVLQYNADRTLWQRVRDGGATPIKTWEAQGALGITGGSAIAARITDA